MKKILGLALLLVAAEAKAQSVENEMTKLKLLAENCLASLSPQSCDVTTACEAFKSYSKELMPDGPAGYYELHCSGQLIPDTALSFSSATAGAKPSLN